MTLESGGEGQPRSACISRAITGERHSMERPTATMLRIGDWCVNPTSGQISRDGETARVEARTMRLLLCLAEHAGEVVSIDDLLNQVWSGVIVSSGLRLPGCGIAPPSARRRPQAAHVHRDSAATRVSDGGDGQSLGGSVRGTDGSSRASESEQSTRRRQCDDARPTPQSRLHVGRRRGALPRARRCAPVPRQGPRTAINRPHPPCAARHGNPSPCCRFSTSPKR